MPKRIVSVIYDVQYIPTSQGLHPINKGFQGEVVDDDHYNKIMEAWNSTPRKSIEIPANREELKQAAEQGIIASTTYVDLTQARWLTIREETELDIASSIVSIDNKKVKS